MLRFGDTYQQVDRYTIFTRVVAKLVRPKAIVRLSIGSVQVQSVLKGAIGERSFDEIK